jgi:CBS domain-containing protein
MKTVRNLLNFKGDQVWTTTPEMPVIEALKLMGEKEIGALVILEDDQVVGIFTERDYARKLILQGRASKNTRVKDVMSSPVISVKPQQSLLECMSLMTKQRIRYLPVMEQGQLKGILSIGDVLHAVIDDQENELQRMEQTVRGETGLLE